MVVPSYPLDDEVLPLDNNKPASRKHINDVKIKLNFFPICSYLRYGICSQRTHVWATMPCQFCRAKQNPERSVEADVWKQERKIYSDSCFAAKKNVANVKRFV